jgi:hypothetical protein
MPVLFARFRVVDLERWKAAFHANETNRREHGLTVRAVYHDATYANGVVIVYDAEDLERGQDFFHSDAQRERMKLTSLQQPAELWMASDFAPEDNPLTDLARR